MSANTLGFLLGSFGFLACIWLVNLFWEWRSSKTLEQSLIASKGVAVKEAVAWCLFIAVLLPAFTIRTIYFQYRGLQCEERLNKLQVEQLQADLDFHRKNVAVNEPVFFNMTYMMTGFRAFKNETHGESCVVSFTAPKETSAMAMTWAGFSIQADNCPTFGPTPSDQDNPDIRAKIYEGMVPDAIVIHAARGDKAADELIGYLGREIKIVRSYDLGKPQYVVPPGGYQHSLWLQFGTDVEWNGERYRRSK